MELFNLAGEVALVTGAGSGIGQRLAVGLAEAGADVACFDLPSSAGLDETIARIEALGRRAVAARGDVTRAEDMVRAVQTDIGAKRTLVLVAFDCDYPSVLAIADHTSELEAAADLTPYPINARTTYQLSRSGARMRPPRVSVGV